MTWLTTRSIGRDFDWSARTFRLRRNKLFLLGLLDMAERVGEHYIMYIYIISIHCKKTLCTVSEISKLWAPNVYDRLRRVICPRAYCIISSFPGGYSRLLILPLLLLLLLLLLVVIVVSYGDEDNASSNHRSTSGRARPHVYTTSLRGSRRLNGVFGTLARRSILPYFLNRSRYKFWRTVSPSKYQVSVFFPTLCIFTHSNILLSALHRTALDTLNTVTI